MDRNELTSEDIEDNARLNTHPMSHKSHLFMVRVWLDNLGENRAEWRGKVQHVLSKEIRYFQGWPMLIAILQELSIQTEVKTKDAEEM